MRARAALCLVVFVLAAAPAATAGNTHKSAAGRYKATFPGAPKESEQKAKSAVGELKVVSTLYATSDGYVYLLSYTDFPVGATKPENRGALFDSVREAVRTRDGKVVGAEKEIAFGPDKLPGREFTVDKGKQRTRYRIVLSGSRLYQQAVIGPADHVSGPDANTFFDSFELLN